jgi:hypothetical protein
LNQAVCTIIKFPVGLKATFLKSNINERQGSAMLAEYLGNDLSKIANELDKLMLNIAVGEEITLKSIQDNIGISKEYNVFELQTALAKRMHLR